MDVLNSFHTPIDTRRPRRATLMASALAHGGFLLVLAIAAYTQMLVIHPHELRALTFVTIAPLPVPPPAVPPKPLRLPPIVKEEAKPVEAPRVAIAPPPVPEVRPDPPVRVPLRRDEPVAAERPKAAPVVTVGAFALNGNSAHAPEMARPVQAAGFDAPEAHAADIKLASATVGAFEQPTAGQPRPGTDRPNVFGDSGFGSGVATGRARPTARVAEGGFGNVAPPSAGRPGGRNVAASGFDSSAPAVTKTSAPSDAVKAADFDAHPAQTAAPQVSRQTPTELPLEVLSKPTPVYSDEARKLQIEGDVVLEVEFTATGEIHVLRVVRGLGHGLDESAARAVQGMRFKPAQRNGQAIDIRTTVSIVFRLA